MKDSSSNQFEKMSEKYEFGLAKELSQSDSTSIKFSNAKILSFQLSLVDSLGLEARQTLSGIIGELEVDYNVIGEYSNTSRVGLSFESTNELSDALTARLVSQLGVITAQSGTDLTKIYISVESSFKSGIQENTNLSS